MVDAGILGPSDRVELLQGEIVEWSPENSRHATGVDLAAEVLRAAFGSRFTIRVQHPIALSGDSEPEPDIAVVAGSPRDYAQAHPTTAVLIVEVADSSLVYDRRRKAGVYAAAGIGEYWISNLLESRLEVHREPEGGSYRSVAVLEPSGAIEPLAAPGQVIRVSDLLP